MFIYGWPSTVVSDIVTWRATDLMEYRIGADSVTTGTHMRFSVMSTSDTAIAEYASIAPTLMCHHCEDYHESWAATSIEDAMMRCRWFWILSQAQPNLWDFAISSIFIIYITDVYLCEYKRTYLAMSRMQMERSFATKWWSVTDLSLYNVAMC